MSPANMEDEDKLDLYDVPLLALRAQTRQILISGLQKKKILPSDEKLPRDWRGLADLAKLPSPHGNNAVSKLLAAWEVVPTASLGLLEQYLGQLDRWDIVDDIYSLIREDAKEFGNKATTTASNPIEAHTILEKKVLTSDDIMRLQQGQKLQMYDALLLHADQDVDFADQMVDQLERVGCKICRKDSLLPGVFQHQSVMSLIRERCSRVIVIVSRNFIGSNANRFFVLYAQAMSIELDRRIIIPCIYGEGPIKVPEEIEHIFKLDFNRSVLPKYDFWGQLQASVTNPMLALPQLTQSALKIHELSSKSLEIMKNPSTSNSPGSAQSLLSVADKKRSSSELSVSTHSSEDSANIAIEKGQQKLKSPKGILKTIFRRKKQPKQSKATAGPLLSANKELILI